MKKKAVFITNIPSPYRVDFFSYMQKNFPEYEFHIIFSGAGMENRKWNVEMEEIEHYHFLKSKTIIIRKRFDDRYVFIPTGVEKTLKEIAPDAVFAMEYNPTILRAVHWCRKKKIPFISWTDGTLNSEKNIGKVQRLSRSYIIKRAAAFIASSTASKKAQIAYGADEKKCFISYLTVDIDKYLYKRPDTPQKSVPDRSTDAACVVQDMQVQLLYVGSLIQRKGLDLLLPAIAKTPQNVRLWIVGEGQEKDLLKKQCAELGISDRVEFLGYQEGKPLQKLYRTADAFVLPTREDCFGLVLLEAMCASLPIISSKYADGAFDLVEDGRNGYIIDPENTDEFAETIKKVSAGDTASAMGKRSYEKAHEFSFEQVSKGCIEALSYVLMQKK